MMNIMHDWHHGNTVYMQGSMAKNSNPFNSSCLEKQAYVVEEIIGKMGSDFTRKLIVEAWKMS